MEPRSLWAGAAYCIYWGEVSEDSDGPIEWCRPVPDDQAQVLAAQFPELSVRTETAHRQAFADLGPGAQISPAQWQTASQSLHAWTDEHSARPSELGVRVTFLASAPATEAARLTPTSQYLSADLSGAPLRCTATATAHRTAARRAFSLSLSCS